MIHEYAIDPEAAVCWGKNRLEFRFISKSFGLGQPRIMSEFPGFKIWRKLFKRAAERADDNEKGRIDELFRILTERRIKRGSEGYDGEVPWTDNALREHQEHPFKAIISLSTRSSCNCLLCSADVGGSHTPHWDVKTQDDSPRTAGPMANVVAAMLANCSEAYFIDPHFGPENARHRRPLKAFLEALVRRPRKRNAPHVEVHASSKAEANFFKSKCEAELPVLIPSGLKVILKRWKERVGGEMLHERFILTDIGGVKVGPGLDDGTAGQTFQAELLARNTFERRWAEYVDGRAFDPAEEAVEIIGRRII